LEDKISLSAKIELILNLQTAKALESTVPSSLSMANEVIKYLSLVSRSASVAAGESGFHSLQQASLRDRSAQESRHHGAQAAGRQETRRPAHTGTTFGEWPLFAKLNNIDVPKVTIETIGIPVRASMLAAGQIERRARLLVPALCRSQGPRRAGR
jgi:hypothetical protein